MTDAPRRLAIYARVSTPDQDVTPQLVRLREWAAAGGYIVHLEQTDVASGKKMHRPGQELIIKAFKGRRVHAVAVCKIDRWARSMINLASTVKEMHDNGVEFHAIDQVMTVKPHDSTSKLIMGILGNIAEWEGNIISERTRDGLRGKVGRGRHPNDCGLISPCPTRVHLNLRPKQTSVSQTNGIPELPGAIL